MSESLSSLVSRTARPTGGMNEAPTRGPDSPMGTGNAEDSGSNRPIATSAALYLYTFLATLFLLLTVSGVIVIRSFILRRRHRLLVEEAIRNGTWVPPPPPFSARTPRVDLSKKPVMWDAYLGSNDHDSHGGFYGGSVSHEDVKDWDAIKPVSAAYLAPSPMADLSGTSKVSANATSTPTNATATSMLVSGLRAVPRLMLDGLKWMAGYPPSTRRSSDLSSAQGNLHGLGSDTSGNAGLGKVENPPSSGPDGGPPVVRVAVIIAMPHPPKPTTASSSASPPIPSGSHPLATNQPPSSHPTSWDDEEPLPVMEMGVAELVMNGPENQGSSSGKAALTRDSSSIRTEEV